MEIAPLSDALRLFYERFVELGPWFHVPVIALLAGMMGSFINVCIWRIPRGQSIVLPRSRCTSCGTGLGVLDLIPVLSYVLLMRGKCRHCKAPVAPRYVIVELWIISFWLAGYAIFGLHGGMVLMGLSLSVLFATVRIQAMKKEIAATRTDAGFTFISVMIAALILGIALTPYMDSARTGFMGAKKNQEFLIAYKLAQERIEEVLAIPARQLQSDRQVYVETASPDDNIYKDEVFGDFSKLREDPKYFLENFSDVFTAQNKPADKIFQRFQARYKKYYGYDYVPYPQGYEVFKRITEVTHVAGDNRSDNFLKKVKVTVTITSKLTKSKKVVVEVLASEN